MEALRNAKYNWYPYKIQPAQLEQNAKLFLVLLFSYFKQRRLHIYTEHF